MNTNELARMNPEAFARLGLGGLAYIRPVQTPQGGMAWGIFGADGAALAVAPDRDLAVAAVVQHEMAPVSVH